MNQELILSILATATAIISALLSLWQVRSKTKADDKFINTLRKELDPDDKKILMELIHEIDVETLKKNQINMLEETMLQVSEKSELYLKRKEELEKLQKEVALLIEKMESLNAQEKKLIIKSVKQPSEQGQIAYLDKLIKEIGKTSTVSSKD